MAQILGKTNPSPTFPMYPAGAKAVTPSDTANLAYTSVIYVGGAGNIQVTTPTGDQVVFQGLTAGSILPIQVVRVWATSTTATNLVAIY